MKLLLSKVSNSRKSAPRWRSEPRLSSHSPHLGGVSMNASLTGLGPVLVFTTVPLPGWPSEENVSQQWKLHVDFSILEFQALLPLNSGSSNLSAQFQTLHTGNTSYRCLIFPQHSPPPPARDRQQYNF